MFGRVMTFLATRDADASRRFYETTLGLTFVHDGPSALVFESAGTNLRIQKVKEVVVAPYTALGWEVADIEATIRALVARGVVFSRYDFFEQDALGVWLAPGGAKVAWFRDPDGHTLSLTEMPRTR